MTKELKKIGYCYASINTLKLKLDNCFKEYENNYFYILKVVTNKGINFALYVQRKKVNYDFNKDVYFSIWGINAAALEIFKNHTNLNYLSLREYESLKGGAPYQVISHE
tara:strand:- start:172 stop:498 length:327 start_codon:yes stop_codon:yes gene_type:complete